MIFFIDETTIDLSKHDNIEALDNLLISHYRGEHFIVIQEISLLQEIIKNSDFSKKSRTAALEIKSKRSFLSRILEKLEFSTVSTKKEKMAKEGDTSWSIPLHVFKDHRHCANVAFIAENLRDIMLFKHAAYDYLRSVGVDDVHLYYHPGPGGGDTTADLFKSTVEEQKIPCICVVDSDKKSPTGSLGETAKKVKRVKINDSIAYLHILDCRTAENAIPLCILKEVFPEKKHYLETTAKEEPFLLTYGNLKNGVFYRDILNIPETKPDRIIWDQKIKSTNSIEVLKDCAEKSSCPKDKPEPCECNLVQKISSNCLEKTIRLLDSEKTVNGQDIRDSLGGDWLKVGKALASMCAANVKLRM